MSEKKLSPQSSTVKRDFMMSHVSQTSDIQEAGIGITMETTPPTIGRKSFSEMDLESNVLMLKETLAKKNLEITILKSSIKDWQDCANDATDRLARISQQRGKKNTPAEVFYDSSIKRIIEKFSIENESLNSALRHLKTDVDVIQLIKREKFLEKQVSDLKQQLEIKFNENQRLRKNINDYDSMDQNGLLKDRQNSHTKISQLRLELTQVKSYLLLKHNVTEYVKDLFESMKDDLVKTFTKLYLVYGENFILDLKNLSDDEIPDFLKQPLELNKETQTVTCDHDDKITVKQTFKFDFDDRVDSGIGKSVTDEQRECYKILTCAQDEIKELKEKNNLCEIRLKEKDEELASWTTALKETHDDAYQISEENRKLIQENQYLKSQAKMLEQVHKNLTEKKRSNWSSTLPKSHSTDTQVQSCTVSSYEPTKETKDRDFLNCSRQSYGQYPAEPWQSQGNPWIRHGLATTEVVADGPVVRRDSTATSSDDKGNMNYGDGSSSTSQKSIYRSSSSSKKQTPASPVANVDRNSPMQTPLDIMSSLEQSLQQKMYPCQNCEKQFPSSLYWDHMRTCMQELEDG